MKWTVLKCRFCQRTRMFEGEDVDQIMVAIDASGWNDMPLAEDGQRQDICPDCDAEIDQMYLGEPE